MRKTLNIYQVDAFTSDLFKGNPAAVVPLESWLDDQLLQSIAAENNLAETAFFVDNGDHFDLRWFTPEAEVDLCGHATLATAHILYSELGFDNNVIRFECMRGPLTVRKIDGKLTLDFPSDEIEEITEHRSLQEALGTDDRQVFKGINDYLVIFDSESEVTALKPDFRALKDLGVRGVIVTAPGNEVDFISRFFAPGVGIDEDPVTGSAHTTLTPYWFEKLGKETMIARQLSKRGGKLWCTHKGDRVLISGYACTYMKGKIFVPEK